MPKCKKCGRKGLFFRVNPDGLCADCVALLQIDKEKQELDKQIQKSESDLSAIRQKYAQEKSELECLQNERQKTYDVIKRQAECAAIACVQDKIS